MPNKIDLSGQRFGRLIYFGKNIKAKFFYTKINEKKEEDK